MDASIGSARLELTVDLQEFQDALKQALAVTNSAVTDLKAGLSVDSSSLSFNGLQQALEGVNSSSKAASESVSQIGERGSDSINKLMKFEVIKGTMDIVKSSFESVKASMMDYTKEFAVTELAAAKLQGGLHRLGEEDYYEKLKKQSEDLERVTPYSHGEIQNMQAMLTTANVMGEDISKITQKVLDLASAFAEGDNTGLGLQRTAMMISKAAGSDMVGALQRYNVVMTETQKAQFDAADSVGRLNILYDLLKDKTTLTSVAFGSTLTGQLKITENLFNSAKETIGKAFAPALLETLKIAQDLSVAFRNLPPDVQALAGALAVVTGVVTALIPLLVAMDVELSGIPLIIGGVVAGIGVLYEALTNLDAIESWLTELVGGQETIEKLKSVVSDVWAELKDFYNFLSSELSYVFEIIKTEVEGVMHNFSDLTGGSDNLFNIIKTLTHDGFQNLKDIITVTIDTVLRIMRALSDVSDTDRGLLGSLIDTSGGFQTFKSFADTAVKTLETMISAIGRVATALSGLFNVLVGLSQLTLFDLIMHPKDVLAQWEKGLTELQLALTEQPKTGTQVKEIYGPKYKPGLMEKPEQKNPAPPPPGSGTSTSGKETDPNKAENDSLKEMMAHYEDLLKLEDDLIAEHKSTLTERNLIVDTYLKELEATQSSLNNVENQRKVREKISTLTRQQFEESDKAAKDMDKFVSGIDDFIEKRTSKNLAGVNKEVADIDLAYKKEYDAVNQYFLAGKIDANEQAFFADLLAANKTKELQEAMSKSEISLQFELKSLKYKNAEDQYQLDLLNVNNKYDKEKERIEKNYKDGEEKSKLLHSNEIARAKELEKVQSEGTKRATSAIQSGFDGLQSEIQSSFKKMWENVFGEAHSLFAVFFEDVMAKLEEMAASSLFKMLMEVVVPAKGFLSSLFGMFDTGTSWTGDGRDDELAGFVHKNEAVMNAMGAQYPFNRAMVDLANKGIDLSRYIPQMPNLNLPPIVFGEMGKLAGNAGAGITFIIYVDGVKTTIHAPLGADANKIYDEEVVPAMVQAYRRIGANTFDKLYNIKKT